jgi:hypothetical protein
MRLLLLVWALLLMTVSSPAVIHAATLDCAGGIISAGDTRADMLAKCGEPDWKDSHDEEFIERLDQGVRRKTFVTVEEWTYNFGPSQFTRIVTLKNGKVTDIRTGKYGYSKDAKPVQRECSEQLVSVGDAKSDVIVKCGEPAWKDIRQEEFREKIDAGQVRKTFVTIEEWTYNLGPNRFVRIFTFRNGKLVDIKTGGYGYEVKEEKKK